MLFARDAGCNDGLASADSHDVLLGSKNGATYKVGNATDAGTTGVNLGMRHTF